MYIFSVYFRIPILYTAYRFGDMEIQGFLGAEVDMHRANEIRQLMKRVVWVIDCMGIIICWIWS